MLLSYDKLPVALIAPQKGRQRRIFFAGKGGVGKTTVASTTAMFLAEQGYHTLLVTTDPAAHTGQLFGMPVTSTPTRFSESTLWLARIDPKAAFDTYKQQVLHSVKEQFGDEQTVLRVGEELNSPCTEEVAVFQEFLDYLLQKEFDVTVFDTAPTGHTIRLLQLSFDYEADLERKEAFTAETAALDEAQLARMRAAIATLQNPEETGIMFVTLAETTPIAEMERAIADLNRTDVPTQAIIVNQVLPPEAQSSRLFGKRLLQQQKQITQLRLRHQGVALAIAPLQDEEVIGPQLLREFGMNMIGDEKIEGYVQR
ncbi:ArsA family ATPase [Sulfoacidibacillus ferrooxidans]|uniref:Arsenical pump-driving ATPase n=1 Tax=Sulfoacidibacillus ferrooxidans TaxID=2005001 RepID=A0A9X1V761_9BACL|nr:ArsA family ATPase [Sulfoacidibacillus ferrooxidans]MCI0182475.1 Arsenical pump-driving ATPase [Sulfoacidibacillus ferrooxidans]